MAAHAAGDSGAALISSEALSDTNEEVHVVSRSTTEFVPHRLTITDFALIGGPELNNPSGKWVPPSMGGGGGGSSGGGGRFGSGGGGGGIHGGHGAAGAQGASSMDMPSPGYSLQDNIEFGYSLTDNIKIGPVISFEDRFYQGTGISMDDPDFRVTLKHISYQDFANVSFDSDLWTNYTAPVGAMARATSSLGTVGLNYIPRLTIHGSRFFFSGVAGARMTAVNGAGDPGMMTNERILGALQANYRISRRWTAYLTNQYSASIGPNLPVTDASLLPDPTEAQYIASGHFNHPVSFRTGAYFRATADIMLSPNLNWFTDQPINTTTFGFSASFLLL